MVARWCVIIAGLALTAAGALGDLSGRWEVHADFDDRRIPGAAAHCVITQAGNRLTGRCENATLTGTVDGRNVSWRLTFRPNDVAVNFTGVLDDEDPVILGKFSYPGKGNGSFLAIKQ